MITKFAFFHKYYKNVMEECTLLPKADEIIRKLKNEGKEIHFITARLMNIPNCDTETITRESLKKYNIPYDSLNMHINDKVAFFKENGIDICIEDSYGTCKEMLENGIKAILMTTKMNADIKDTKITRVNTWEEIYREIKKIEEINL